MGETKVRIAADEADISTIAVLAREIWTEHYASIIGMDQVEYMLGKYQSKSAVSDAIESGYTYCIALYDDLPCGYFAIKEDNGIFLSKFYVVKRARGKGIGRTMLEWIERQCRTGNNKRIWLTCNKYNSDTIQRYLHMGFEIIDSIVTDIGSGYVMDDYVLEKTIQG